MLTRRDYTNIYFKKLLKGIEHPSRRCKRARRSNMPHGSGKELQRNASTKALVLSGTIWKLTTNPAVGQFLHFKNLFLSD